MSTTIQVIAAHDGSRVDMTTEVHEDNNGVLRIADTARETADMTVMTLMKRMAAQYGVEPAEPLEAKPGDFWHAPELDILEDAARTFEAFANKLESYHSPSIIKILEAVTVVRLLGGLV